MGGVRRYGALRSVDLKGKELTAIATAHSVTAA